LCRLNSLPHLLKRLLELFLRHFPFPPGGSALATGVRSEARAASATLSFDSKSAAVGWVLDGRSHVPKLGPRCVNRSYCTRDPEARGW
jgi:hypothetical protein